MDNFVLVGKAGTVFRLLELKLKYEEQSKHTRARNGVQRGKRKRTK